MAGLDFMPFSLALVLFWTVAIGGLGWGFGRSAWRPAFFSTFLVSTLVLFFLAASFFPGRDLLRQLDEEIYAMQDASWWGETTPEEDRLLDILEGAGLVPTLEQREGKLPSLGFGDNVGRRSLGGRGMSSRNLAVGLKRQPNNNYRDN